jgi:hypothetical protein
MRSRFVRPNTIQFVDNLTLSGVTINGKPV